MTLLLGLDRTLLWLAGRVLSLWVRPTALPVDEVDQLRGRGRRLIDGAAQRRSLADLLALAIVCRRIGLPSPLRAFRIGALREPRPVIALKRSRGWLRSRLDRRVPERLTRIIAAGGAVGDLDLDLVPVSVFWGRAPGKEGSWLRLLFSEDWTLTGPFRRFLSTLVNGRSSLVRFGDPTALGELLDGPEPRRGCRRLLRVMRTELRNARSAVIGPDLSHRRTVVAEVLAKRAVRAAVALEIRDRNTSRREALLQARRYAYEIAPDISPRFVAFASGMLHGSGTVSSTASRCCTPSASSSPGRVRRSSTCPATAATWTTCCSPTSSTTAASPCRTSPAAPTSICRSPAASCARAANSSCAAA